MTPGRPRRFRLQLLALAAFPLAVGGVAAVAPPLVALGVGVALTVAAVGLLWWLTIPLDRLVAEIDAASGSDRAANLPTARVDELGRIASGVNRLLSRISSSEDARAAAEEARSVAEDEIAAAQSRTEAARSESARDQKRVAAALDRVVQFVEAVANGTPAAPLSLDLPTGIPVEPLTAATQDLAGKVNLSRQRLGAYLRVLNAAPMPLLATDDRGGIRFANVAAERALGRPLAELARTPLASYLRSPAGTDPTGQPPLPAHGVFGWLADGAKPCVAENSRGVRFALAGTRSASPNDPFWCVALRDLTDDHARHASALAQTREESFASALALSDRNVGGTGDTILAQTRQLIGEAKQTPQRDALVPRLRTIQQSAADLDAQARITRWLAVVLWGELPPPARVEFLAGESLRSTVDLLSVRLKAQNATVNVTDHGGWIYCDEEWFRTAALGVLTHAAAAALDNPIGVKLRRLPCSPGHREGSLEIEFLDAGPTLTPDDQRALAQPFGGCDPTPFLPTAESKGYLPGLLLASRLTSALGGTLGFDATPSGRLVVRMVVPTRLPDANDAPTESSSKQPDVGHPEELVIGWKLGTAG